jgi:hypothetical protein
MTTSRRAYLVVLTLVIVPLGGCGGATASTQPTSPMTADDEAAFENGIDYVETPSHLEGQWYRTWTDEVDRRVGRADAIAILRVRTIRVDTDLARRTTYRLHAETERELRGDLPREVELLVSEEHMGYPSVHGNDRRILDHVFLAFLKWAPAEEGAPPMARWHLSPSSDDVVEWVEGRIVELHEGGAPAARVIVHEQ